MIVVNDIYHGLRLDLVITLVVDRLHSETSQHYDGCPFYVLVRGIDEYYVDRLVMSISEALTDEFDVVKEPTHIHIEFQPKRKRDG